MQTGRPRRNPRLGLPSGVPDKRRFCVYWGYRSQLADQARRANIPGVQDMNDSGEQAANPQVEEIVRIGYNADVGHEGESLGALPPRGRGQLPAPGDGGGVV